MSDVSTSHNSICPHCGLPSPAGTRWAPYCCSGCRVAHDLLQDRGLTRYYDLRRGDGVPVGDDAGVEASWAWLEPTLAAARATTDADGTTTLSCDVQGIHCAGCVWLMQTLFERQDGAVGLDVNPGLGRLTLSFEDGVFPVEGYLQDLSRFGYRSGPAARTGDARDTDLLMRLGVTAALAMNSMVLSVSNYFGLADGDELHGLFAWINLALATLAVLVGGPVFFRAAIAGLRRRALHLDLPIALGIALAWGGSLWLHLSGQSDAAYFDTLTIFITLMLAGRWLQQRLVARNRRMLLEDQGVGGLLVRRIDAEGAVSVVPVADVRAGDRLLVTPGELVPTDARLDDDAGPASFSLAWINGESSPVDLTAAVPAGAHLVGASARRLVAATDFSESGLRQLLTRAPHEDHAAAPSFWDRLARAYVVLVLGFAVAAVAIWASAGLEPTLRAVVAVLVITCPCAIGLATPLAYELGHAALRRRGLFVRSVDLFDRAVSVRKVLLDKTGTLTLGRLTVEDTAPIDALSADARAALFQMTARSNHPKSRAVFAELEGLGLRLDPDLDVREEAGVGMTLADGATTWTLRASGDREWLQLARDGAVLATLAFREDLRHDARREVAALHAAGLEIWLLSGDDPARVHETGEALGLPADRCLGGLRPEDKAAFVRDHDAHDTLMIGDGINDAPALDAAWLAGTPAVDRPTLPARADFYLLGAGLGPIAEALATARRVRRTIIRNLTFAVAYNAAGVALALAGLLSPVVCAVAMPLSSVAVLTATAVSLAPRRARMAQAAPALKEAVA